MIQFDMQTGDRIETDYGRRLTVDEVRSLLLGASSWRVEARLEIDGKKYVCLADSDASTKYRDMQNTPASMMCGRIVWGPVAFLEWGVEI